MCIFFRVKQLQAVTNMTEECTSSVLGLEAGPGGSSRFVKNCGKNI